MSLLTSQPNWFDSTETGAPVLNNALGALVTLLKAVLVNGFNVKSVSQIEVVSGVATVTCASHGYSASFGKLVAIAGAPVPALNGNFQPTGVTTNTFAFPAVGVADGVYTGTIDARRAPLGWEIAYENGGGTVVIFRRTVPESTAMMLRVNDSAASGASTTDARVVMIESASDVDTYSGVSPTNTDQSGGLYWQKGTNNATAKRWAIVGNDRFMWLLSPFVATAPYDIQINWFGDLYPYKTPAPYDCVLCGALSANATNSLVGGSISNGYTSISASFASVIARSLDASTLGERVGRLAPGSTVIGATNAMHAATDVIAIAKPVHVSANDFNTAGGRLRGEMPGLAAPLGRAPFAGLGQFAVVTEDVGDGRSYLSVLYTIGSSQNGNALIDLSGPWH